MKTLMKAASIAALSLIVYTSAVSASPARHHGLTAPHKAKKPLLGPSIICDDRTHVYYLYGDPHEVPPPQHILWYQTEAQAIAAGYHRAGSHPKPKLLPHPIRPHHPMMAPHK